MDDQSLGSNPGPADGDVQPDAHERPEPTGRPDVDAILDRLHELEGLPPSQHVDFYEDAHRRLHEALLAAGEAREHPVQPS